MRVLAISGSLRAASINSAFCRVASRLASPPHQVLVFRGLGELPLFNPDLESRAPAAVEKLRASVGEADALLIASPEYAHGISGALKNALDWLVSFEGVVHKPIALVNTSPRAHHAHDATLEVLRTMSTRPVGEACLSIPLLGACTTEDAMAGDPQVQRAVRSVLDGLAAFLGGRDADGVRFPFP